MAKTLPTDHLLPAMLRMILAERETLTRSALAELAGMSRSVVSEALSGHHPLSETTVERLACALGFDDVLDFYARAVVLLLVERDGPHKAASRMRALVATVLRDVAVEHRKNPTAG